MIFKLSSLLVLIGAALATIFSSFSIYSVLGQMGLEWRDQHSVQLPPFHVVGISGILMLGIGVLAVTIAPRNGSAVEFRLLILAMIAFFISAIFVGYGNGLLRSAFIGLASAETIDSETFLEDVRLARIPLLLGWFFVIVGALPTSLSVLMASPNVRKINKSPLDYAAIVVALITLLVFFAAGAFSELSMYGLRNALAPEFVDPSKLARNINGMVFAMYAIVLGFVGCSIAVQLRALASSLPGHHSSQES